MAIFFFVVGLEVKRELVHGELSEPRRAALPVVAALGGMLLPLLIFLSLNAGADGVRGWGIPMATDIAFALVITGLAFEDAELVSNAKLGVFVASIVAAIGGYTFLQRRS